MNGDFDINRDDLLKRGDSLQNNPLSNFAGSFLLFRGALMNKEWIKDWVHLSLEGNSIKLTGITSTSKNLEVALDISKCDTKYEDHQQPVLFVYCVRNYDGFRGFRMNNSKFTAYPQEQEYLLMEGFQIYVAEVENDFLI